MDLRPLSDFEVEDVANLLEKTVDETTTANVTFELDSNSAHSSTCTVIPHTDHIKQQKCPVCLRSSTKFRCPDCQSKKNKHNVSFCGDAGQLKTRNDKLRQDLCAAIGKEGHASLWECVSQKAVTLLSLKTVLELKREQLRRKKMILTEIICKQGKHMKMADALKVNWRRGRQPTFDENGQKRTAKVEEKRSRLHRRCIRLKEVKTSLLCDIFRNLVPLKPACIMNPNEPAKSRHSMTICEGLAEATQTHMRGGRWVLADSSSDPHPGHCFNVAGCRLLDYSQYSSVRAYYFGRQTVERQLLPSLDVCACTAALTNLHVLLFSLYRIFDAVCLPYPVSAYNPFSVIGKLDQNEFDTSVIMLNINIATLCVALGLSLNTGIDISRPACNLYTLYNNAAALQTDHVTFPKELWHRLRELTNGMVWCEPMLVEGNSLGGEDDWEHVTTILPQAGPPTSSGWTDLLSSATTSIAAIFTN